MIAGEHGLAILIADFERFYHDAMIGSLRVAALFSDGRSYMDRIAQEDGADEAHAVVSIGYCAWIDVARGHANRDTQNQRAVGDSPAKWLRAAPGLIHVVRIKIAGLTGM